MSDFRVQFDQDVHIPGQEVTGNVILDNRESKKANFLKICIHGDAHTKWTESEHHHRTNSQGEREGYTENVEYSDTVNYLTEVIIAWRCTDGTNCLPVGPNIFPFKFFLPPNCPPSYEGFHGHVRYTVHIELDRPEVWKFNKRSEKCFTVVPPIDLTHVLGALSPMMITCAKNTGLIFKNGVVTMTVSLPKKGYVLREVIPITVDIDNGSKKVVASVRAYLHQCSHYVGTRRHSSLFPGSFHSDCPHAHKKNEEKQLQESRRTCKILPHTKGQVALSLKVPKMSPSFQCPIIGVGYHITVFVDTMSTFGGSLHCEFPLVIGTIPTVEQVNGLSTKQLTPSAPPMTLPPVVLPSAPVYPGLEQFGGEPPAYSPGQSAPPVSPTPSAPPPSYEESMNLINGCGMPSGQSPTEDAVDIRTPYPVHL